MTCVEPNITKEKVEKLKDFLKPGDKIKLRYTKMKYDAAGADVEVSTSGFKTLKRKLPFLALFTDGTTMQWADVYKGWSEFKEIRRSQKCLKSSESLTAQKR